MRYAASSPRFISAPEPWDDPELMTKVIAHEAAHLIICERYGHMKPDPHDVEWLELNQLFLTSAPEVLDAGYRCINEWLVTKRERRYFTHNLRRRNLI